MHESHRRGTKGAENSLKMAPCVVDPFSQGDEEEDDEDIADGGGEGDGRIIGWKEHLDEADEKDAVADDGGGIGEEPQGGAEARSGGGGGIVEVVFVVEDVDSATGHGLNHCGLIMVMSAMELDGRRIRRHCRQSRGGQIRR